MAGITAAVSRVQTVVSALTGMRDAPARASQSQAATPYAVVYPGPSEWDGGPSQSYRNLGALHVDVYLSAAELGITEAAYWLEQFIEALPKALMADGSNGWTLTSTVTALGHNGPAISYQGMGTADNQGVTYYLARWLVNYKLDVAV